MAKSFKDLQDKLTNREKAAEAEAEVKAEIARTYFRRPHQIQAMRIDDTNSREVAAWCGGHSTDDLYWSETMECYLRPEDQSLYFNYDDHPVSGCVMLDHQLVYKGEWIYGFESRHGNKLFHSMADEEFQFNYTSQDPRSHE